MYVCMYVCIHIDIHITYKITIVGHTPGEVITLLPVTNAVERSIATLEAEKQLTSNLAKQKSVISLTKKGYSSALYCKSHPLPRFQIPWPSATAWDLSDLARPRYGVTLGSTGSLWWKSWSKKICVFK